eukprot:gene6345-4571_t
MGKSEKEMNNGVRAKSGGGPGWEGGRQVSSFSLMHLIHDGSRQRVICVPHLKSAAHHRIRILRSKNEIKTDAELLSNKQNHHQSPWVVIFPNGTMLFTRGSTEPTRREIILKVPGRGKEMIESTTSMVLLYYYYFYGTKEVRVASPGRSVDLRFDSVTSPLLDVGDCSGLPMEETVRTEALLSLLAMSSSTETEVVMDGEGKKNGNDATLMPLEVVRDPTQESSGLPMSVYGLCVHTSTHAVVDVWVCLTSLACSAGQRGLRLWWRTEEALTLCWKVWLAVKGYCAQEKASAEPMRLDVEGMTTGPGVGERRIDWMADSILAFVYRFDAFMFVFCLKRVASTALGANCGWRYLFSFFFFNPSFLIIFRLLGLFFMYVFFFSFPVSFSSLFPEVESKQRFNVRGSEKCTGPPGTTPFREEGRRICDVQQQQPNNSNNNNNNIGRYRMMNIYIYISHSRTSTKDWDRRAVALHDNDLQLKKTTKNQNKKGMRRKDRRRIVRVASEIISGGRARVPTIQSSLWIMCWFNDGGETKEKKKEKKKKEERVQEMEQRTNAAALLFFSSESHLQEMLQQNNTCKRCTNGGSALLLYQFSPFSPFFFGGGNTYKREGTTKSNNISTQQRELADAAHTSSDELDESTRESVSGEGRITYDVF